MVGKNSRQNEEVTFHQAAANDVWLHARGVPGAHVNARDGGRHVPEGATLREAAALAANDSQARESGAVEVDYTESSATCAHEGRRAGHGDLRARAHAVCRAARSGKRLNLRPESAGA